MRFESLFLGKMNLNLDYLDNEKLNVEWMKLNIGWNIFEWWIIMKIWLKMMMFDEIIDEFGEN